VRGLRIPGNTSPPTLATIPSTPSLSPMSSGGSYFPCDAIYVPSFSNIPPAPPLKPLVHAQTPARPNDTSDPPSHGSRRSWQYNGVLSGSINNSILLTSLSLTCSNESSAEPHIAVSNNDCTIKFFDVNMRGTKGVDVPPKRIMKHACYGLMCP
jgi:hypothetical protein